MEVSLAVLADYASVSQEGKLNILGVFGEINPPLLPFALPQMYLVSIYDAGPAEVGTDKTIRIAMLDGDGNELLSLQQAIKVPELKRPGSRITINHVVGMAGVKFDKPGDYAFVILVGGEEKRTVSLHVNEPPKGAT